MKAQHIIQTIVAATLIAPFLLIVQSCRTPQPIVQTEVKEVLVDRVITDTIVTIAPDSASIRAYLECDSAGNVLIKELQEVQGKNVSLALQLKNSQKGKPVGTLSVDCKQDSLEKVIELKNETIKELSNNKHTETIEVKYIPAFVKVFAWIGGGACMLVLIAIALWVYKKFFLK